MRQYEKAELDEALRQFTSLIHKTEKVLSGLRAGTAQHTLSVRRLAAYRLAVSLLEEQLAAVRAMLYPIRLAAHNPEWAQWFEEEKASIQTRLGASRIASVRHIGSTSVEGLTAKPIVDILLQLKAGTDLSTVKSAFKTPPYVCLDSQTIPTNDQILFLKGYTDTGFAERVFHIHVRYEGDWDEIYFRDYLSAHPETAQSYAALKTDLLHRYEHDRDGYTLAKSEFIAAVTKKARQIN